MIHSSILGDVKKFCQIPDFDDGFDTELLILINSTFMSIAQISAKAQRGVLVTGSEDTWASLIEGDDEMEGIKAYVCMKVKMIFDPPSTSFVLEAYKNEIAELEWRLHIHGEEVFDG